MFPISEWYILPAAFLLDLLVGDPAFIPHPICWMGNLISKSEEPFRRLKIPTVVSGGLFTLCMVAVAWAVATAIMALASFIHGDLARVVEILMIWFAISTRSLKKAALAVSDALRMGGIEAARVKVGMIVGRDTSELDERGVLKAAVETVAENLVDGVISPLFFAAVGGAPFAMAYKMVNTLDSMVGYRNEKYMAFGKASARVDDVANFIPARLSVFCVAMANYGLARRWKEILRSAWRDGRNHLSPNAGYPEASFAEALEVTMGGPSVYFGKVVDKAYICEGYKNNPYVPATVESACRLMVWSAAVSLIGAMTLAHVMNMVA
ncbi:adenosylcobinamide-phosphate synthase CbiB [Desulfoluna spongiiphila]|uniref:Cobalamin biosynthesis protein CobD n=1 Tax=Desulfoluna spongiiphila TaxID=419481 RepID=A0A1G5JDW3_9BACT|nr:adenosylcobinamide-phosphate synthase CbiB [Desulfoluna spongiiphila]SCY85999.1 adenosylcobinamide-phosphate synthase [Desulfoluna spongiiphila]VVS90824.1 cobalamin biosynthesis cobd/cbib [Desulfoluna spongiiphila]